MVRILFAQQPAPETSYRRFAVRHVLNTFQLAEELEARSPPLLCLDLYESFIPRCAFKKSPRCN